MYLSDEYILVQTQVLNLFKRKMLYLRRTIKPLKLFYSNIKHGQTVTTWSPLANYFNSKPESDQWEFLKNWRTVR